MQALAADQLRQTSSQRRGGKKSQAGLGKRGPLVIGGDLQLFPLDEAVKLRRQHQGESDQATQLGAGEIGGDLPVAVRADDVDHGRCCRLAHQAHLVPAGGGAVHLAQ